MSRTKKSISDSETTKSDVASAGRSKPCYVKFRGKVYDVTHFLPDHPGGEELITDYAGEDVTSIMQDETSHVHSDSAYEALEGQAW